MTIKCPNCAHANAPDASFCSNCGQELNITCPNCSTGVPPGSHFCPNCGFSLEGGKSGSATDLSRYLPDELLAKIQAAREGKTMAGERRTVTMLFADVQGSTGAAEQLDPEDWAEIINGAFERMIQPIYRYEGTLARLQGDAVLGFFGAPIAHEDDPERAVMAGLEMLEAVGPYSARTEETWGIPIGIRIGINTGLVVVGEVGSDLRVEYTALGDAVNVAARMEQTAAPGTIQISEHTHKPVAPLFDFVDLGDNEVKGKTDPVRSYRVTGRAAGGGARRGTAPTAPIVGRDQEIQALNGLVEDLLAGRGGVCTIIADAGLGKSRLLSELRDGLQERALLGPWWERDEVSSDKIAWAMGQALSYNTVVPYWPVMDLVMDGLDIHPSDANDTKLSKMGDALKTLLPDRADELVPYLAFLLGIDAGPDSNRLLQELTPPQLQRRTFGAVSALIEAAAMNRPVIVVFEDLHWADPVSLAFVEELMEVTDRAMLLVIAAMRPYREDASWKIHEAAARDYDHRYTSLSLEPLAAEAISEFLRDLLGDTTISPEVMDQITAKSEGNPFYVEEMFNSLLDSRALLGRSDGEPSADSALAAPETITGLLTARLDRLDADSKLVVQMASVIGRQFRFDELEEVADESVDLNQALSELLRRKFLEEVARIPHRIYAFRHALVQETAYTTVLKRSRRELHGHIGRYLEVSRPDDVQEIANHLLEAGEDRRALPYLIEAGDRAARAMSLADAIRIYDRALSIAKENEDAELVARALRGRGEGYTLIPDLTNAAAAYQEMLEYGRSQDEPTLQVNALNKLGFTTAALGGDYDRATEFLENARRLAHESGDELGLAEYHMHSCMIATGRGDMERAAAHDAETARIGEAAGVPRLRLAGLTQRVLSLVLGEKYEEASAALEEARRVAEGHGDQVTLAALAAGPGVTLLEREGKVEEALKSALWAAERTKTLGSSWAAQAAGLAGYIAGVCGRYESALALAADGVRLATENNEPHNLSVATALMARLYAEATGDTEQVAKWREQAFAALEMPMGGMMAGTVWHYLGAAALALGELDQAVDSFDTGSSTPSATQFLERPWSLLGSGVALVAQGNVIAAQAKIASAEELIFDRDLKHIRPALALAKGRLGNREGNPGEALVALAHGAAEAESMSLLPVLWQIQAVTAHALSLLGRDQESGDAMAQAESTIARIVSDIVDEDLRTSFSHVFAERLVVGRAEIPGSEQAKA